MHGSKASVHVQADEENGRISLGRKGKLNHYQLYKKLLHVWSPLLPSPFSSATGAFQHSCHSRCSGHLHSGMKNEPTDSKHIRYTSVEFTFVWQSSNQMYYTNKTALSTKGVTWGLPLGFCRHCQLPPGNSCQEKCESQPNIYRSIFLAC